MTMNIDGRRIDLMDVREFSQSGRVMALRVSGFTVRLLNLGEDQRALIRTWVARATMK